MIGGYKITMDKVRELKKIILEIAYNAKEGHIASSFSIMDILWVLYNRVMSSHDLFILSKGHASLALYTILYDAGYINKEQLYSFCKFDSELGGHPKLNPKLGINMSGGSLGHGLPTAVGIALAKKINNKPGVVYCLIGDGEANEGTIYESMLLAKHHNLQNLCLIVDNNDSINAALTLGCFEQKAVSFGWFASGIVGHNYYDLETSLKFVTNKPKCIVAHTVKGCGCKLLESDPQKWHHSYPTQSEYLQMMEELSV